MGDDKMYKVAKVFLATSILITGVSFTALPTETNVAQAAVTPYYTYNGYAGYNAKFVTDKTFINALRYNNITMNNVKVDAKIRKFEASNDYFFKKKYDQVIEYINHKPTAITFSVTNKSLKLSDVKKAYAKYQMSSDKVHRAIIYNVNGQQINFVYNGNDVTSVIIGRYHS